MNNKTYSRALRAFVTDGKKRNGSVSSLPPDPSPLRKLQHCRHSLRLTKIPRTPSARSAMSSHSFGATPPLGMSGSILAFSALFFLLGPSAAMAISSAPPPSPAVLVAIAAATAASASSNLVGAFVVGRNDRQPEHRIPEDNVGTGQQHSVTYFFFISNHRSQRLCRILQPVVI